MVSLVITNLLLLTMLVCGVCATFEIREVRTTNARLEAKLEQFLDTQAAKEIEEQQRQQAEQDWMQQQLREWNRQAPAGPGLQKLP